MLVIAGDDAALTDDQVDLDGVELVLLENSDEGAVVDDPFVLYIAQGFALDFFLVYEKNFLDALHRYLLNLLVE